MKIILTEKRELVTKNGKKGYVINGTFIPLDDKRQDGKNDGIPEVTGGNKGAQGTQKDNSGVTTVTPGAQGTQTNKGAQGTQTNQGAQGTQTNQGAQGTQTNKGAQDNSDEDEGSEVARTGKYSTDSQGRDYDDPEYGQPAKKVEPTNQGAQGTQKVVTPKITTKSGKELPKPREVKKGSTRERMINRNVEIHGADKIINLRNKNAAFQATRKKGSGYSMDDFVKDFPNSNTAKERRSRGGGNHPDLDRVLGRSSSSSNSSTKAASGDKLNSNTHYTSKIGAFLNNKKVGDPKGSSRNKSVQQIDHNNESYDAYDLVLDYVITEGHAENQDEANYVMMQMTSEQIQHIVSLYEV